MDIKELEKLPTGSELWLITGMFTASRVRLIAVRGQGAVRRPVVEALDTCPGEQAVGEFGVAAKALRPMAARV